MHHDSQENTKKSILFYLLLAGLFLTGIAIDPFANNVSQGGLRFLILLALNIICGVALIAKTLRRKQRKLPDLKILVPVIIFAALPLLTVVAQAGNLYPNLFNFSRSSLIPLFCVSFVVQVMLISFPREQLHKFVQSAYTGFFIGATVSLLMLILNVTKVVSAPNLQSDSYAIITTFALLAALNLVLAPLFFSRIQNNNGVFFYGIGVILSIIGLIFVSTIQLLFVVGLAFILTVVMLQEARKKIFFYVIVFVVLASSMVLIKVIQPISQIKDGIYNFGVADLGSSTAVTFSALSDYNLFIGSGVKPFNDLYLHYQPKNFASSVPVTPDQPFSDVFRYLNSYGLLFTLVFFFFVINVLKESDELKHDPEHSLEEEIKSGITVFYVFYLFLSANFYLLLPILLLVGISTIPTQHDNSAEVPPRSKKVTRLALQLLFLLFAGGTFVFSAYAFYANQLYGKGIVLATFRNIDQLQLGVDLITQAERADTQQYRYKEELANIYAVSFQKLNDASKQGVNIDVEYNRKILNVVINLSNDAIQNNSSYYSWLNRFNLLQTLNKYGVDVSAQLEIAAKQMELLAPHNGDNISLLAGYYANLQNYTKANDLLKIATDFNPHVDKLALEYAKSLIIINRKDEAKLILNILAAGNIDQSVKDEANLLLAGLAKKNP
jgi:hypothetical protein